MSGKARPKPKARKRQGLQGTETRLASARGRGTQLNLALARAATCHLLAAGCCWLAPGTGVQCLLEYPSQPTRSSSSNVLLIYPQFQPHNTITASPSSICFPPTLPTLDFALTPCSSWHRAGPSIPDAHGAQAPGPPHGGTNNSGHRRKASKDCGRQRGQEGPLPLL